MTDGTGIIEEVRFGSITDSDITLSRDILYNSPALKRGDILIYDRGYIDRGDLNFLKRKRGVDVYIPLRTNMDAYKMAVSTAIDARKWTAHPTRKNQKIALVKNLHDFWRSDDICNDVDFNACVVWDTEATENDKKYFVFITTDLTKSAKHIIQTYALRWEIEEDFRQLKDKLHLEHFRTKNLSIISYHIICVLFGYLFFKLYTLSPQGEKYANRSLPAVLKSFKTMPLPYLVLYSGVYFAILQWDEFIDLYTAIPDNFKEKIKKIIGDNYALI